MNSIQTAAATCPIQAVCRAVKVPRSTYYRWRKPSHATSGPRPSPPRTLREAERQSVLQVLNAPEHVDLAPAQVHAKLLDKGEYLCSVRTMYRILDRHRLVRERRRQARHTVYSKPELLATAPNQVWSWDITKLKGPRKGTYYQLYVVMDIFSRCVVGWMVADREQAVLAQRLIAETCAKQSIRPGQLSIHADRGAAMRSKPVALLMADLGITKSHSRPHVSNDNAYSEAQFKTLKYCPQFPERFGCLQDARNFCRQFFTWYNTRHYHSGIAWMTPATLHSGDAVQVRQLRQRILDDAYTRHPERFVRKSPTLPQLPLAVWINKPIPASNALLEAL